MKLTWKCNAGEVDNTVFPKVYTTQVSSSTGY